MTWTGRSQVDNDQGIIKDYYDDQIAADSSGVAYARVLEKFLFTPSTAMT